MPTTATILKNGPIKIDGSIEVKDPSGKAFPPAEGKPVFLCRCGYSGHKPFCDGSHGKMGFESAVAA